MLSPHFPNFWFSLFVRPHNIFFKLRSLLSSNLCLRKWFSKQQISASLLSFIFCTPLMFLFLLFTIFWLPSVVLLETGLGLVLFDVSVSSWTQLHLYSVLSKSQTMRTLDIISRTVKTSTVEISKVDRVLSNFFVKIIAFIRWKTYWIKSKQDSLLNVSQTLKNVISNTHNGTQK